MIKFNVLILFSLLGLFSDSALARLGDGPIVPWPTRIEVQKMGAQELVGEWVAYDAGSVWFIDIAFESYNLQSLLVRISSPGLFTGQAQGLFLANERVFSGELIMDSRHKTNAVFYRNAEGIHLRIKNGKSRFIDLDLERMRNSR